MPKGSPGLLWFLLADLSVSLFGRRTYDKRLCGPPGVPRGK